MRNGTCPAFVEVTLPQRMSGRQEGLLSLLLVSPCLFVLLVLSLFSKR
jgi:hypothetical protein